MTQEQNLHNEAWLPNIFNSEGIYNWTLQILEYARQSLVLRIFNKFYYELEEPIRVFESVGAHVNLMREIVDRALIFEYGSDFIATEDGYSYRDIMEAIARHDLPENDNGDVADDGTKNITVDAINNIRYWHNFAKLSTEHEVESETKIFDLLLGIEFKHSSTGKLLYLADKVSAIIMALVCDMEKVPPLISINTENLSELNKFEIAICDYKEKYMCKGSEMWTIDYFKGRNMVDLDEKGFITALVIMATLIINHKWYKWRKKDYKDT